MTILLTSLTNSSATIGKRTRCVMGELDTLKIRNRHVAIDFEDNEDPTDWNKSFCEWKKSKLGNAWHEAWEDLKKKQTLWQETSMMCTACIWIPMRCDDSERLFENKIQCICEDCKEKNSSLAQIERKLILEQNEMLEECEPLFANRKTKRIIGSYADYVSTIDTDALFEFVGHVSEMKVRQRFNNARQRCGNGKLTKVTLTELSNIISEPLTDALYHLKHLITSVKIRMSKKCTSKDTHELNQMLKFHCQYRLRQSKLGFKEVHEALKFYLNLAHEEIGISMEETISTETNLRNKLTDAIRPFESVLKNHNIKSGVCKELLSKAIDAAVKNDESLDEFRNCRLQLCELGEPLDKCTQFFQKCLENARLAKEEADSIYEFNFDHILRPVKGLIERLDSIKFVKFELGNVSFNFDEKYLKEAMKILNEVLCEIPEVKEEPQHPKNVVRPVIATNMANPKRTFDSVNFKGNTISKKEVLQKIINEKKKALQGFSKRDKQELRDYRLGSIKTIRITENKHTEVRDKTSVYQAAFEKGIATKCRDDNENANERKIVFLNSLPNVGSVRKLVSVTFSKNNIEPDINKTSRLPAQLKNLPDEIPCGNLKMLRSTWEKEEKKGKRDLMVKNKSQTTSESQAIKFDFNHEALNVDLKDNSCALDETGSEKSPLCQPDHCCTGPITKSPLFTKPSRSTPHLENISQTGSECFEQDQTSIDYLNLIPVTVGTVAAYKAKYEQSSLVLSNTFLSSKESHCYKENNISSVLSTRISANKKFVSGRSNSFNFNHKTETGIEMESVFANSENQIYSGHSSHHSKVDAAVQLNGVVANCRARFERHEQSSFPAPDKTSISMFVDSKATQANETTDEDDVSEQAPSKSYTCIHAHLMSKSDSNLAAFNAIFRQNSKNAKTADNFINSNLRQNKCAEKAANVKAPQSPSVSTKSERNYLPRSLSTNFLTVSSTEYEKRLPCGAVPKPTTIKHGELKNSPTLFDTFQHQSGNDCISVAVEARIEITTLSTATILHTEDGFGLISCQVTNFEGSSKFNGNIVKMKTFWDQKVSAALVNSS